LRTVFYPSTETNYRAASILQLAFRRNSTLAIESAEWVERPPKAVWSEPVLDQFQTSSRPPFDVPRNCRTRDNTCTGRKHPVVHLR